MTDIQLTEHFKLSEFTRSGTTSKYNIPNVPNEEQIANLKALCVNVLEPLRQWYGKPIVIGSGYRCPAVNNHPEVRGATNSQHMKGEAADLHLPSIAIGRQWLEFILDQLAYDQVIWEHDKSGHYWIHISFKRNGKNRQVYLPNLLKK